MDLNEIDDTNSEINNFKSDWRRHQVLECMIKGASTYETADLLRIAPSTCARDRKYLTEIAHKSMDRNTTSASAASSAEEGGSSAEAAAASAGAAAAAAASGANEEEAAAAASSGAEGIDEAPGAAPLVEPGDGGADGPIECPEGTVFSIKAGECVSEGPQQVVPQEQQEEEAQPIECPEGTVFSIKAGECVSEGPQQVVPQEQQEKMISVRKDL